MSPKTVVDHLAEDEKNTEDHGNL